MTPDQQFIVAVIGAAGAIVVALFGVFRKVETVHLLLNSALARLLDTTDRAARAEGHAQGITDSPGLAAQMALAHVAAEAAAQAAARLIELQNAPPREHELPPPAAH